MNQQQIASSPAQWKPWLRDPRTYSWAALVISLGYLYQQLALLEEAPTWITSDTLWPVHLTIDLFVDGFDIGGWYFSVAPCWFPDVVLVGLVYGLSGNAVVATIVGGFLHLVLLVLGIVLCWRTLSAGTHVVAETLTVLTGVAITLYVASGPQAGYGAFHQFYIPQSHIGNLINVVWALALALALADEHNRFTRRKRGRLVITSAYVAIGILATMSNVLFVAHFVMPLTIAAALLFVTRALTASKALQLMSIWPAAIAGYWANKLFLTTTDVTAQSILSWVGIKTAFAVFTEGYAARLASADPLHLLTTAWLCGCCAIFIFLNIGRDRDPRHTVKVLFFVVVAMAAIGSVAAAVVGGTETLTAHHDYDLTRRYLHPMFFLPILAWPAFVAVLQQRAFNRVLPVMVAGAIASACVSVFLLAAMPLPQRPLHRYAPQLVRDLDAYAGLHGLKYGVAGYWQARLITLLSRAGLRVYQVDRNLQPHRWVSNIQWYSQSVENRDQVPPISFAVLQDHQMNIQEGHVTAVLGTGAGRFLAGGVPVLIYPDRAHASPDKHCSIDIQDSERAAEFEHIDLSGGCLEGTIGYSDNGVWATRPDDTAGYAKVQPTIHVRPGAYTIDIEYSASSFSSDPVIAAVNISLMNAALLHSESLDGDKTRFRARFIVPRDQDRQVLDVRVYYSGLGALTIHGLILRREE